MSILRVRKGINSLLFRVQKGQRGVFCQFKRSFEVEFSDSAVSLFKFVVHSLSSSSELFKVKFSSFKFSQVQSQVQVVHQKKQVKNLVKSNQRLTYIKRISLFSRDCGAFNKFDPVGWQVENQVTQKDPQQEMPSKDPQLQQQLHGTHSLSSSIIVVVLVSCCFYCHSCYNSSLSLSIILFIKVIIISAIIFIVITV